MKYHNILYWYTVILCVTRKVPEIQTRCVVLEANLGDAIKAAHKRSPHSKYLVDAWRHADRKYE